MILALNMEFIFTSEIGFLIFSNHEISSMFPQFHDNDFYLWVQHITFEIIFMICACNTLTKRIM